MEFALILRELGRRKLVLALGVIIAAAAAVFAIYKPDGLHLKPRSLVYSSSSTQVLVDTAQSSLGNSNASLDGLVARATVVANVMASPATLDLIGSYAGIPGDQIYAAGPVDPLVPRTVTEPTALKRNVEITGENDPYRIQFLADPTLPTIGVFTQAPTGAEAIALANGSVDAVQAYIRGLETSEHIPAVDWISVRQLGSPTAGVVDGGISKKLAAIVFIAVMFVWCIMILVVNRFRQTWQASGVVSKATRLRLESVPELAAGDPADHGDQHEVLQRNGNGHGGAIVLADTVTATTGTTASYVPDEQPPADAVSGGAVRRLAPPRRAR